MAKERVVAGVHASRRYIPSCYGTAIHGFDFCSTRLIGLRLAKEAVHTSDPSVGQAPSVALLSLFIYSVYLGLPTSDLGYEVVLLYERLRGGPLKLPPNFVRQNRGNKASSCTLSHHVVHQILSEEIVLAYPTGWPQEPRITTISPSPPA